MHDLYTAGIAKPPTDAACEREQQEMLNPLPVIAPTCPSCEGHNVSDATGHGACGDCGLTDNLSAFMGGGMTDRARYQPSKFANQNVAGAARKVRAFTISGSVD